MGSEILIIFSDPNFSVIQTKKKPNCQTQFGAYENNLGLAITANPKL